MTFWQSGGEWTGPRPAAERVEIGTVGRVAGVVSFDKDWMVQGHTYGVRIIGGVEEWWEKVGGNWVRHEGLS